MANSLGDIDVFILCGGLGTRLRPHIEAVPKVLAQIDGRPFLGILLDYLASQGFRRVVLGTGYKADMIEEFCRQYHDSLSILFSREEAPLGTGGALKQAQGHINSNPFFALNGDCFCPLEYRDVHGFHSAKGACATLVVSAVGEKHDFGSITIGSSDEILNFTEKTTTVASAYVSAGIYCFNRDVFDDMPPKASFSIETEFFPAMVGKKFFGFKTSHAFIDIGTPERLARAGDFLEKER